MTLGQEYDHQAPKKAGHAKDFLSGEVTDQPSAGILAKEVAGVDHA